MKPKRRISRREVWLVSLLPAALVVIVSLGLPDKSEQIAQAERRLDQAYSGDAIARQHSELQSLATQLDESRQALEALVAQEADLLARIQALQAPVAGRTQSMAEALDELTRRLAGHGVQVLAMMEANRAGRSESGAPARGARVRGLLDSLVGGGAAARQDWQVTVAATWPAVREALAETDTFPPGLALAALQMAPARPTGPLRRWELVVSDLGARR